MSELFPNLVFLLFAGMTASSALLVVAFRNLLHAAVALFFCLTGVAGLYVMLGADFLGVTQLLVYAGGILVLIVFGVFLTARIYDVQVELRSGGVPPFLGFLISAVLLVVLCFVIWTTQWPAKVPTYAPTASSLGDLFLTKYLVPFEFISLLLLLAMIGAVALVQKEMEAKK